MSASGGRMRYIGCAGWRWRLCYSGLLSANSKTKVKIQYERKIEMNDNT